MFKFLEDKFIKNLTHIVSSLNRDLLFKNVDPLYVATLSYHHAPIFQGHLDLHDLNKVKILKNGTTPLLQYLKNLTFALQKEGSLEKLKVASEAYKIVQNKLKE